MPPRTRSVSRRCRSTTDSTPPELRVVSKKESRGLNQNQSGVQKLNKVKKEETVEDEPQKLFSEGELVFVYYANHFRPSKVVSTGIKNGEWRYFVHFCGFHMNWDTWVGADVVLKYSEGYMLGSYSQARDYKNAESMHSAQAMQKTSDGVVSQPIMCPSIKVEVKSEVKLEAEAETEGGVSQPVVTPVKVEVKSEVKLEAEAENDAPA